MRMKFCGIDYVFSNGGTDFASIIEAYARGATAGLPMPEPIIVAHETAAVAMATAVQATRIGLVIFAIPFLFAYNPIMLIVPEGGAAWDTVAFLFVLIKLAAIVYMLSSAASGFDKTKMHVLESILRIAIALIIIHPDMLISGCAIGAAIAIFAGHRMLKLSRT